jgi:hypothetical protein
MSIACVGTWVAFLGTVRPHAVEAV